jgi:hypothetical protein
MARLTLGVLRPGSGKTLCYADVDIDGIVSIIDCTLYQDNSGQIVLGLPLRKGTDDKWRPTVKLSDGARRSLLKRLHDAFLASDLSKPGTNQSVGAGDDPFEGE